MRGVQSPTSAAGVVFAWCEIALAVGFSKDYSRRRPSVHKEQTVTGRGSTAPNSCLCRGQNVSVVSVPDSRK